MQNIPVPRSEVFTKPLTNGAPPDSPMLQSPPLASATAPADKHRLTNVARRSVPHFIDSKIPLVSSNYLPRPPKPELWYYPAPVINGTAVGGSKKASLDISPNSTHEWIEFDYLGRRPYLAGQEPTQVAYGNEIHTQNLNHSESFNRFLNRTGSFLTGTGEDEVVWVKINLPFFASTHWVMLAFLRGEQNTNVIERKYPAFKRALSTRSLLGFNDSSVPNTSTVSGTFPDGTANIRQSTHELPNHAYALIGITVGIVIFGLVMGIGKVCRSWSGKETKEKKAKVAAKEAERFKEADDGEVMEIPPAYMS